MPFNEPTETPTPVAPLPQGGGSYVIDDATGTLTPVAQPTEPNNTAATYPAAKE